MSEGIIKYSMSNVLIPSNYKLSKKNTLKLNKSENYNEKIVFNLPLKATLATKTYSPHKISSAISAKLKNARQNLNRYRIQIVNKSVDKILLFPQQNKDAIELNNSTLKLSGLLQQKMHEINNRKNRKLFLNIGKHKKRYSTQHSQPRIQIQQRIFTKSNSHYKQQSVRQYLKMSTIKQFFSYIDETNPTQKSKKDFSLPKLIIQNILTQKQKTQNKTELQNNQINQNKQDANNKFQERSMYNIKIQKSLKIKPSQVISSRIQNSSSKLSMLSTYLKSSTNREFGNNDDELIKGWDQKKQQQTIDLINLQQKFKKGPQKIIIKAKLNRYNSEENQLDKFDSNERQLLYKSEHRRQK